MAPDERVIADGIDDMYAAFLAGDRRRFDAHLHPELTTWETHLPGPLLDRAALDSYRNLRDAAGERPALARLAAEQKRIEVWGDTGLARYVLAAMPAGNGSGNGNGERRYRVTDVLRRTDGEWLVVHHHAELVRSEAA